VSPGGEAQVVATAFLGAVTRLTVRLADGTLVKADLPTHDAAALGPGAAATVSLSERPVLVAARAA
jgi:putative spermidine/putrescine transport system ATP-binding protein